MKTINVLKGAVPVIIAFLAILFLRYIFEKLGYLQTGLWPIVYVVPIMGLLGYYIAKKSKW